MERGLGGIAEQLSQGERYTGPIVSRATFSIQNVKSTSGFQLCCFQMFQTVKKDTMLLWWNARDIAITLQTLTSFGPILCFFLKLIFIIEFKELGTKTRFVLLSENPFYEYNQYLAGVREIENDNSQPKNDVSMESAN